MMNNNENTKRSVGNLTPRKGQLLEYFSRQRRPYSVKTIDGEPVVYRLEKNFDVEISQSKRSPFYVYIWSLGESGRPLEIVRRQEVQSRDIPAAAAEIDRLVAKYLSEVANAV